MEINASLLILYTLILRLYSWRCLYISLGFMQENITKIRLDNFLYYMIKYYTLLYVSNGAIRCSIAQNTVKFNFFAKTAYERYKLPFGCQCIMSKQIEL